MSEDHKIFDELLNIRRRIRLAVGLRGALLGVGLLGLLTFFSLAVDRFFRLGVPARGVLLVLYSVAFVYFVWKYLLRPLRQQLDHSTLADLVERERPAFQDVIRSAVDFLRAEPAGTEVESFLRESVISRAGTMVRQLGEVQVIDRRVLGRAGGLGVGALIIVLTFFLFAPVGTASIWFQRTLLLSSAVDWPYRTRLIVEGFEGGSRGIPRGDPLEIYMRVEGEEPERAWIHLHYGADSRRHALSFVERQRLRYSHPEVREEFQFHVRGGDFRSPEYRVRILERPRLEKVRTSRYFPRYIGAAPEVSEKIEGELSMPEGTRLEIEARSSKPLARASLRMASGRIDFDIDETDPHLLRGTLMPTESESVVFDFRDIEGVVPETPTQIHLRLIPDRKPDVKLKVSGIGTMVSPQAMIPFRVESTDDYRVDALRLHHSVVTLDADRVAEDGEASEAAREGSIDLEIRPDSLVQVEGVFDVATLGLEPEVSLSLQAGGEDSDTLGGPKTGVSTKLDFLVVSARKLNEDFLRRQEEQRRAFERLREVERDVRDSLYRAMDGGLKAPGALAAELANALRGHARQERSMATQVLGIARAFETILEEMRNNRVGEADDIKRLADRVIPPLRSLADPALQGLSSDFIALGGVDSAPKRLGDALELSESIESVLETMDQILVNMVRLEGFTEIVNRLRGIIKLTGESADSARESYEKMLEAIFDE